MDARAAAYARLFETVHEGVYIGTVGPGGTSTLAANAHLKLILGYDSETPDPDVRPFAPEQCPDAASRLAFLDRLSADGAVVNYLIRLSRADRSAVWVEITGRAEREGDALRIEALFRAVIHCTPVSSAWENSMQNSYFALESSPIRAPDRKPTRGRKCTMSQLPACS